MSYVPNGKGTNEEPVGISPCMLRLREQVRQLARCDVHVLLEGESGTGKEVFARAIHRMSRRAVGPFVGVNCAAINKSLLESELFGHLDGAFTGSRGSTIGFLRAANHGTILLDEIGDVHESLQVSLLRVLEEHVVTPVGGTEPIPIDVRVIAASHRNLGQAVKDGTFREDLFYRLNVVRLHLPPLRQRREDIPLLTEHLLIRIAGTLGVPVKTITPAAMELLVRYHWPGNVRQLSNVIQRAYVLGIGSIIDEDDLPNELSESRAEHADYGFPPLREAIRSHVERALELSGGARGQAAALLGIDRKSLWRMMQRHHLT